MYYNITVQRGKCLQILKSKESPICKSDCTSLFVLHGTFIPGFIKTGIVIGSLAQLFMFIPPNPAVRISSVDVFYKVLSL